MKRRAATTSKGRGRAATLAARGIKPAQSRKSAPAARARSAGKKSSAKGSASRASAKRTTDHNKIRRWAEERGGTPSVVKRTVKGKKAEGVLRIDFPGFSGGKSLKPVSWDEWFDVFEERRLALLHQNKTAAGKPSRFNKLVCRD